MSGSEERGLGKDRVEVSGFSTKALDHAFSELRGAKMWSTSTRKSSHLSSYRT